MVKNKWTFPSTTGRPLVPVEIRELVRRPCFGEDPPDRSLADPVADAEELALDAPVSHRDCKFTAEFDQLLGSSGVRVIKTPVRSPRANSFAEQTQILISLATAK